MRRTNILCFSLAKIIYCPLFGVGVVASGESVASGEDVASGEGVPKGVGVASGEDVASGEGVAKGVGVASGEDVASGEGVAKGVGVPKGEGVAKGEGAVTGAASNLALLISNPSAIGPKARTGKKVSAPRIMITPAVTVVKKTESVLRVPVVSGTGCLLVMLSAKSSRARIGT